MRAIVLAAGLAFAAGANALDSAQWPPPESVQARMHELQASIRDPASTRAQRDAARAALAALLKSPAGQARGRTPDEKPARAAIQPFPSVVKPLPPIATAVPPDKGIARVEVVPPQRPPTVNPRTGSVAAPTGRFAIDPASGAVLHEVPGGYVDPRTGQFVPR